MHPPPKKKIPTPNQIISHMEWSDKINFIIAKWRADEFFFKLYEFDLNEIYNFIY